MDGHYDGVAKGGQYQDGYLNGYPLLSGLCLELGAVYIECTILRKHNTTVQSTQFRAYPSTCTVHHSIIRSSRFKVYTPLPVLVPFLIMIHEL